MTDSRDEHEPYAITPAVEDADIVPWLRLEADAAAHQPSPWMMLAAAANAIERLTAERDEARRLLKAVVDITLDNMAPDATHPKHPCDFVHRPDIAMCKVCENWTDAMVMCYPDDFQDEEDKP
jgi:hypothetical protein